jgi:Zn-dependent peptidase ImmA (M78 family)
MAMQVRRLLQAVELEREAIPQLDVDALEGDVEAAAHSVRQLWELPRGPLKNLVESVEDHGGIVLEMPEDISELDGLGMSSSDLPPLFFVDLTKPVDRLRFTLAHELGHVVLHSIPSPDRDTEREADRFAAEFLMPRKDILPDFSDKVTLESLASMKPYWRVSMAALLRRARDLGVIDEGRYRYLNVEMSRRGYKRREPAELDLDPERPSLLRDIIEFHRRELGYSVEEIAKLVNDYPAQVKQRYLQTRSHLRLVG